MLVMTKTTFPVDRIKQKNFDFSNPWLEEFWEWRFSCKIRPGNESEKSCSGGTGKSINYSSQKFVVSRPGEFIRWIQTGHKAWLHRQGNLHPGPQSPQHAASPVWASISRGLQGNDSI